MGVSAREQERYWSRPGKRRAPEHPAVAAFARPKVDLILRALDLPRGDRPTLLEIGAGSGYFSVPLMQHFDLTCLDLSQAMLDQNPLPAAKKLLGDAQRLEMTDDSYDYVFCSNLLHHLPEPEAAMREMRRVARRAVLIVEPNALNPLMFAFSAFKAAERGALKFSARYVKRLGRDAGLELRCFRTHGSIVPNATPVNWVSALKRIDRVQPLGFYHVAIFDV